MVATTEAAVPTSPANPLILMRNTPHPEPANITRRQALHIRGHMKYFFFFFFLGGGGGGRGIEYWYEGINPKP